MGIAPRPPAPSSQGRAVLSLRSQAQLPMGHCALPSTGQTTDADGAQPPRDMTASRLGVPAQLLQVPGWTKRRDSPSLLLFSPPWPCQGAAVHTTARGPGLVQAPAHCTRMQMGPTFPAAPRQHHGHSHRATEHEEWSQEPAWGPGDRRPASLQCSVGPRAALEEAPWPMPSIAVQHLSHMWAPGLWGGVPFFLVPATCEEGKTGWAQKPRPLDIGGQPRRHRGAQYPGAGFHSSQLERGSHRPQHPCDHDS